MQAPGEQLLLRLWETMERAGGALFGPWQARRMGRAMIDVKREEMLALAQAEREVQTLRSGDVRIAGAVQVRHVDAPASDPDSRPVALPLPREVVERVSAMTVADALQAEVNRAKSVLQAATLLGAKAVDAPESRPDADWVSMWRENAGKATAEQLQNLWGRVLAGEVMSPGRFALRTLDFLRTLSKNEADDIARLAPFVVEQMVASGFGNTMRDRGVTFDLLVRMQALGLIAGVGGFDIGNKFGGGFPAPTQVALRSTRKVFLVEAGKNTRWTDGVTVRGHRLTPLGVQLMELGDFPGDDEVALEYGAHLAGHGYEVHVCDVDIDSHGMARSVNCRLVKRPLEDLLAPKPDDPSVLA